MMIEIYAVEIEGKIEDYVVRAMAMGVLMVMLMLIVSAILGCR